MNGLLCVLVGFAVMEPLVYLSHRFVMHRFGFCVHKSHHQGGDGGPELNDLYPLSSAAVTVMLMAAGASLPDFEPLLWVGTGVTAYGAGYFFVHDVYIHRRLPFLRVARMGVCEHLKAAHRIHHLYGGEPYGMLFPVVPAELWERASRSSSDPFARKASSSEAPSRA